MKGEINYRREWEWELFTHVFYFGGYEGWGG